MSIKIGSLLEHRLWRFKDFNSYGRNVESFLWLYKKNGKKERLDLILLHNNVHFDSKSGLPSMSFLGQVAYGFEGS